MKKIIFFSTLFVMFLSFIGPVSAIANPAATNCIDQGYKLENGNCFFDDGKMCEEWAFYRGECGEKYWKEMACRKAGEEARAGKCCEDLLIIVNDQAGPDGSCMGTVGGWGICSNCGNDVCEDWENSCNCPSDCSAGVVDIVGWSDKRMICVLGVSGVVVVLLAIVLFFVKCKGCGKKKKRKRKK